MADMLPLKTSSLADAAFPALPASRTLILRNVLLAVAGSLLMVAAAKVKVPFWPVPMTLQTLVVLALGATYGARLGAATILLYVGYGLAGLPVFTNTPPVAAGPLYLLGPTGGFLAGFVVAAAIAGWAAQRGASTLRLVAGLVLADVALFAFGFLWLAFGAQLASGVTGVGFAKAFAFGVQPFLLGEALKVALAACFAGLSWQLLERRR